MVAEKPLLKQRLVHSWFLDFFKLENAIHCTKPCIVPEYSASFSPHIFTSGKNLRMNKARW